MLTVKSKLFLASNKAVLANFRILDGVQTYHIHFRMGATQGPFLLSLMHLASAVSEMKMLKVSRQTDAG